MPKEQRQVKLERPCTSNPSRTSDAEQDQCIRVWRVSGEEVATVRLEDAGTVKELKKQLHKKGLPLRFRQRIMHENMELEDDKVLAVGMEVQLVLINFPSETPEAVKTALREAAEKGSVEEVERLLQDGARPDPALDASGRATSALMVAAKGGHAEVVDLLLEARASKNLSGKYPYRTALMIAAEEGHLAVVRSLLKAGASVNPVDQHGNTALKLAASRGHAAVVGLLLEDGARVDLADKDGLTALMLAAKRGAAKVVDLLLEAKASVDFVSEFRSTALVLAAAGGHAKVVHSLLQGGASPDRVDGNIYTALMWAAEQGHPAAVDVLLGAGANKDFIGDFRRTILMRAAAQGHPAVVRSLLKAGASIDRVDAFGYTALQIAALRGQTEADSHDHLYYNNIFTRSDGHAEVVDLLMKADARKELVNKTTR